MAIITDRTIALNRLKRLCPPDVIPTLTDPEIGGVLDDNLVVSVWTTATPYNAGDVVMPITRNGHRFICIAPGTSGATEPPWPALTGDVVFDGSTLRWQEDGPETDFWDLQSAAYDGWELKLAKATPYATSADGLESVYQHCKDRLAEFKPCSIV